MEEKLKIQNAENTEQMSPRLNKYIKYGIIYFSIVFIITGTFIGVGAYNVLSYPNIYQGVYIHDTHVGGESKASAIEKITQIYQQALVEKEVTISCKGVNRTISSKRIGAKYNVSQAVLQAFNVGRQENVIKRLFNISHLKKNNVKIPLTVQADQEQLHKEIKKLADEIDIPVKEYEVKVVDDILKIKNGLHGERININQEGKKVLQAFAKGNTDPVLLVSEIVKPKPIDVTTLYDEVCTEPADSYFEIVDYRIHIVPHVIGKKFDQDEARKIISNHRVEQEEFEIPLVIKEPVITKEVLEQQLFQDKMASYTTSFNAGNVPRSHNIALAASKISEAVLGSGDTFSYNEVVGERTLEAGYQNAHVYLGDEIVDGIGGGICQVSTTLYNAVLFSDLKVDKRVNHSMTVGYVPVGQDAAVAYGLIDFKFTNDTGWPIKLVSEVDVKKGKITFDIFGTNETPEKTIEIESTVLKTIPFPTEYVDEPELEKGKTEIKQNGGNGYEVETYKVIKQNGKVVSKELISRSNYRPIKQIEKKGIKEVEIPITIPEHRVIDTELEEREVLPPDERLPEV